MACSFGTQLCTIFLLTGWLHSNNGERIHLSFKEKYLFVANGSHPGYVKKQCFGYPNVVDCYDWYDANIYCMQQWGTQLASVHSSNDLDEIYALCLAYSPAIGCWIGYNDIDIEGTWRWIDGTDVDYIIPWSPGDPDNLRGIEHCAFLGIEYPRIKKLEDTPCENNAAYPIICNAPRSPDPTVSPSRNPSWHPTISSTYHPTTQPTIDPTTTSPTTTSPTQPTEAPTTSPTFYPSYIHWSHLPGISCLNLNDNIESIDHISLNECKYECINNYLSCDSIVYFYLLDKTNKPRCYLFSKTCEGYLFTDKGPTNNVSTFIALNVYGNGVLSDCINYPLDWEDALSEYCDSYNRSYCLNNDVLSDELENIVLHRDNKYGYSANDVCCVCGGGIYEVDRTYLRPYIQGIFLQNDIESGNVCNWSEHVEAIEKEHGIKFNTFHEWDIDDIFTLCEISLYQKKDQFASDVLQESTCYSVLIAGQINVCEFASNLNDSILIFSLDRNALYLNSKWINSASFIAMLHNANVTSECFDESDYDGMKSKELLLKISACELLDDITSYDTTSTTGDADSEDRTLIYVAIACIVVLVVIVVWMIFVNVTDRDCKCKEKHISTPGNTDNGEIQPMVPIASAPPRSDS
eukprot:248044_1